MLLLLEIFNLAKISTLLVSIPESVGLLLFGIGLVVAAVLIRSFLARGDKEKADKKITKEA